MKRGKKFVFKTFVPFTPSFISRPGARYWREFEKLTAFLQYAMLNLRQNEVLICEMAVCRVVDNYVTYVSELLGLIFSTRPETLKSSEEVTLEFVLTHRTTPQLINAIVRRKVDQLSYQGMKELLDFCSKRLKFPLFREQDDLIKAILLVEIRNIIAHNRGLVNDTFLRRVRDSGLTKGHQIKLQWQEVLNYANFLSNSVATLEHEARKKFEIPQPINKLRKTVEEMRTWEAWKKEHASSVPQS